MDASVMPWGLSFQSDCHFRFSVSCKAVGFMIYELKHFISDCFDVYFFLWSNGASHWEREKFLWEQEQIREWTYVQSKRQKCSCASRANGRRVHFAPKVVQDPPSPLHQPSGLMSFMVGNISVPTTIPLSRVFGRLADSFGNSPDPIFTPCSSGDDRAESVKVQNSNPSSWAKSICCAKCLEAGHWARSYRAPWCCLSCKNLGHKAKCCRIKSSPRLIWAPKC